MSDKKAIERIQRTTESIFIVALDDEENYRRDNQVKIKKYVEDVNNHRCTVCSEIIFGNPYPHPALRVLVCIRCSSKYDKSIFPQDINGVDKNCRWCSQPAEKFNCNACTCTFCEHCIDINLGENFVKNIQTNWTCFVCNPSQLWFLRAVSAEIMENIIENRLKEEMPKSVTLKNYSQRLMKNRRVLSIDSERENNHMQKVRRCSSEQVEQNNEIQSNKNIHNNTICVQNKESKPSTSSLENDNINLNNIKLEDTQIKDILSNIFEAQSHINNLISTISSEFLKYSTKKLSENKIKTIENVDKIFQKMTKFCSDTSENFSAIAQEMNVEKERLFQKHNIQSIIDVNVDDTESRKRKYYQENGYCDQLIKLPSYEEETMIDTPKITKKICLSTKKDIVPEIKTEISEFDNSHITDSQLLRSCDEIEHIATDNELTNNSDIELVKIAEKIEETCKNEVNNNKNKAKNRKISFQESKINLEDKSILIENKEKQQNSKDNKVKKSTKNGPKNIKKSIQNTQSNGKIKKEKSSEITNKKKSSKSNESRQSNAENVVPKDHSTVNIKRSSELPKEEVEETVVNVDSTDIVKKLLELQRKAVEVSLKIEKNESSQVQIPLDILPSNLSSEMKNIEELTIKSELISIEEDDTLKYILSDNSQENDNEKQPNSLKNIFNKYLNHSKEIKKEVIEDQEKTHNENSTKIVVEKLDSNQTEKETLDLIESFESELNNKPAETVNKENNTNLSNIPTNTNNISLKNSPLNDITSKIVQKNLPPQKTNINTEKPISQKSSEENDDEILDSFQSFLNNGMIKQESRDSDESQNKISNESIHIKAENDEYTNAKEQVNPPLNSIIENIQNDTNLISTGIAKEPENIINKSNVHLNIIENNIPNTILPTTKIKKELDGDTQEIIEFLNKNPNLERISNESMHIKSEEILITDEIQIKTEIEDVEDRNSNFSLETLILNAEDDKETLDNRIKEDFPDDIVQTSVNDSEILTQVTQSNQNNDILVQEDDCTSQDSQNTEIYELKDKNDSQNIEILTKKDPSTSENSESTIILTQGDSTTEEICFQDIEILTQNSKSDDTKINEISTAKGTNDAEFSQNNEILTQVDKNDTENTEDLTQVDDSYIEDSEKQMEIEFNFSEEPEKEKSQKNSDSDVITIKSSETNLFEENESDISTSDREEAYLALKYPSSTSCFESDNSSDSEIDNISLSNNIDRTIVSGFTTNGLTVLPWRSSDDDDESQITTRTGSNDEKIRMTTCVNLFESKKYVENWLMKHNLNSNDKEEDEINRLTNIESLKRIRNDSSSDNSSSRKKTFKRIKKSKKSNSNESDFSLNSNDSDFELSGSTKKVENNEKSIGLSVSDQSWITLDDWKDNEIEEKLEEITVKRKKSKSVSLESISSDEEILKEKTWRDDPLLNKNLNLENSDSDFQIIDDNNEDKKKNKKKIRRTSSSDQQQIFSEISDSEDDVEFVSETKNVGKHKRRNIRSVLGEESLNEDTKRALKEEKERKLRLTQKQQTLDTMLSQSSINQEETGQVLDIDEDKNPLVTINTQFTDILKPHQLNGIKFMWEICFESVKKANSEKGTGCILGHCMGLGKTRQIVVLTHILLTNNNLREKFKKILIICPLSTVQNWHNEYKITLKNIHTKIKMWDLGTNWPLHRKLDRINQWKTYGGILILGYDTFKALVQNKKRTETQKKDIKEALLDPGPDVIVCDEGHMLKDGKTLRFKAIADIKTSRRIILTGTPLQNNLKEYYHMVSFVKPKLLGTEQEYNNRFVNPILNGQYEDSSLEDINLMRKRSHVLHKKLETTVQRFESSELEKYMPEKLDYILFIGLCDLQQKIYQSYLNLIDENSKKKLFQNYHTLLNVWTHPALLKLRLEKTNSKTKKTYEEDFQEELDPDVILKENELNWFQNLIPSDILTNIKYGPKLEILLTIIDECVVLNDKLLVFSSSMIELDLIENFLALSPRVWRKNFNYYRMDGTVEPDRRNKYCNEFNNEHNTKAKLFLISYKVGGLGLNLFAANRVVLMDVSWNPTYDMQSVYRAYRFGQKKNVFIYRLVSMGTMEEVVCSRGITKLAISRRVVDEQQISRHFKSDDLQKMYHLQTNYSDRPVPKIPEDRLLANLLVKFNPILFKYCKHQSLLEVLPHEELNEEDRKKAWEEFENEEMLAKMPNNPIGLNIPTISKQPQSNIQNSYIGGIYNQNYNNQNYNQFYQSPSFNNAYYPYPQYSTDHTYTDYQTTDESYYQNYRPFRYDYSSTNTVPSNQNNIATTVTTNSSTFPSNSNSTTQSIRTPNFSSNGNYGVVQNSVAHNTASTSNFGFNVNNSHNNSTTSTVTSNYGDNVNRQNSISRNISTTSTVTSYYGANVNSQNTLSRNISTTSTVTSKYSTSVSNQNIMSRNTPISSTGVSNYGVNINSQNSEIYSTNTSSVTSNAGQISSEAMLNNISTTPMVMSNYGSNTSNQNAILCNIVTTSMGTSNLASISSQYTKPRNISTTSTVTLNYGDHMYSQNTNLSKNSTVSKLNPNIIRINTNKSYISTKPMTATGRPTIISQNPMLNTEVTSTITSNRANTSQNSAPNNVSLNKSTSTIEAIKKHINSRLINIASATITSDQETTRNSENIICTGSVTTNASNLRASTSYTTNTLPKKTTGISLAKLQKIIDQSQISRLCTGTYVPPIQPKVNLNIGVHSDTANKTVEIPQNLDKTKENTNQNLITIHPIPLNSSTNNYINNNITIKNNSMSASKTSENINTQPSSEKNNINESEKEKNRKL